MPRKNNDQKTPKTISIIGTVGVPANYGGFETLVHNLVEYHAERGHPAELTVYCSSKAYNSHPKALLNTRLRYVPLNANGPQSIPYDIISLFDAMRRRADVILLLGVSGALVLPLVRALSNARIVTNIDGIEWKREKWRGLAKTILRWSEAFAVRWSHAVIADNEAIADHVLSAYSRDCHVIAYGGDHAVSHTGKGKPPNGLPKSYALGLCRIEPENNVHTILEAWSHLDSPLVFVGNWSNSQYGCELKDRYGDRPHLYLMNPVYEPGALHALRSQASLYVHGHSAGGTNPSLVEMMHFGVPVLAHGCAFNRHSTEDKARYFVTPDELVAQVRTLVPEDSKRIGADMREIAIRRYTWAHIGEAYFELLEQT